MTTSRIPAPHPSMAVNHQRPCSEPDHSTILATPTGGPQGVSTFVAPPATTLLSNTSILPQGGSQPHENTQPFLCINFILPLFGEFPTQT